MKKYFLLTVSIVFFDQLTKFLVLNFGGFEICRFFNIEYITNTGASFGMFQGWSSLLAWLGVIMMGLIIYNFDKIQKQMYLPWMVIIAGIIGNTIDRFLWGHVVDFLSFSFWPAFNVADMAITLGVAWLIVKMIRNQTHV